MRVGGTRAERYDRIKRAFDATAAAVVFVLTLPVLALAALAIRVRDGRDVLFHQDRLGIHGTTIRVTKLRTMRARQDGRRGADGRDGPQRVTGVGRVIRRFKVDELPQLLGVVRVDLSLVGPRATLVRYLPEYDQYERRRLEVMPGLTGWAQINGGTELTHRERNVLDVWYVDNRSLLLDTSILIRTIPSILSGERPNMTALGVANDHETLTRGRP